MRKLKNRIFFSPDRKKRTITSNMREIDITNNYLGLHACRFQEDSPLYIVVGELDREIADTIFPSCIEGKATFSIRGINGLEAFSANCVFGDLRVRVEYDLKRMLLSCVIPFGELGYVVDPSLVSYSTATYKGRLFRDILKEGFYEECGIARGGLLACRNRAVFEYDPSLLPEGVSEFCFESAISSAYSRLCPSGKVGFRKSDRWIGVCEDGKSLVDGPYLQYLLHRELQVVAPTLGVRSWLPETSRIECQSILGVVDAEKF